MAHRTDGLEGPSLTRLLKGFRTYFPTAVIVLCTPSLRAAEVRVDVYRQFWKGLDFFSYGIAIGFALCIPIFIVNDLQTDKLLILGRSIVWWVYFTMLAYCALKLCLVHNASIRNVATSCAYLGGIIFPFSLVARYPAYWNLAKFGRDFSALETPETGAFLQSHLSPIARSWMTGALFVLSLLCIALSIQWFSTLLEVSRRRVLLAILLWVLLMGATAKYFQAAFPIVERLMKLVL